MFSRQHLAWTSVNRSAAPIVCSDVLFPGVLFIYYQVPGR